MLNVVTEVAMDNMRNVNSGSDGPSPSLTVRVIMQGKVSSFTSYPNHRELADALTTLGVPVF